LVAAIPQVTMPIASPIINKQIDSLHFKLKLSHQLVTIAHLGELSAPHQQSTIKLENHSVLINFANKKAAQSSESNGSKGTYMTLVFIFLAMALLLGLFRLIKKEAAFAVMLPPRKVGNIKAAENQVRSSKLAAAAVVKPPPQALSCVKVKRVRTAHVSESNKKNTIRNDIPEYLLKKVAGNVAGQISAKAENTSHAMPEKSINADKISPEKTVTTSSLKDMGNFFADYDQKQDGTVSEFLATRNAITHEQLIGWSRRLTTNRHFPLRLVGAPISQM
jgi:hypothetical protein